MKSSWFVFQAACLEESLRKSCNHYHSWSRCCFL